MVESVGFDFTAVIRRVRTGILGRRRADEASMAQRNPANWEIEPRTGPEMISPKLWA